MKTLKKSWDIVSFGLLSLQVAAIQALQPHFYLPATVKWLSGVLTLVLLDPGIIIETNESLDEEHFPNEICSWGPFLKNRYIREKFYIRHVHLLTSLLLAFTNSSRVVPSEAYRSTLYIARIVLHLAFILFLVYNRKSHIERHYWKYFATLSIFASSLLGSILTFLASLEENAGLQEGSMILQIVSYLWMVSTFVTILGVLILGARSSIEDTNKSAPSYEVELSNPSWNISDFEVTSDSFDKDAYVSQSWAAENAHPTSSCRESNELPNSYMNDTEYGYYDGVNGANTSWQDPAAEYSPQVDGPNISADDDASVTANRMGYKSRWEGKEFVVVTKSSDPCFDETDEDWEEDELEILFSITIKSSIGITSSIFVREHAEESWLECKSVTKTQWFQTYVGQDRIYPWPMFVRPDGLQFQVIAPEVILPKYSDSCVPNEQHNVSVCMNIETAGQCPFGNDCGLCPRGGFCPDPDTLIPQPGWNKEQSKIKMKTLKKSWDIVSFGLLSLQVAAIQALQPHFYLPATVKWLSGVLTLVLLDPGIIIETNESLDEEHFPNEICSWGPFLKNRYIREKFYIRHVHLLTSLLLAFTNSSRVVPSEAYRSTLYIARIVLHLAFILFLVYNRKSHIERHYWKYFATLSIFASSLLGSILTFLASLEENAGLQEGSMILQIVSYLWMVSTFVTILGVLILGARSSIEDTNKSAPSYEVELSNPSWNLSDFEVASDSFDKDAYVSQSWAAENAYPTSSCRESNEWANSYMYDTEYGYHDGVNVANTSWQDPAAEYSPQDDGTDIPADPDEEDEEEDEEEEEEEE
eukprot:g3583.t1